MLDDDVIEESKSLWSSNVVLVIKKGRVNEILRRLQETKQCNENIIEICLVLHIGPQKPAIGKLVFI